MEIKRMGSWRKFLANTGFLYTAAAALFIFLNMLVSYQIAHAKTVLLLGALSAFLLLAIYVVIAIRDKKKSVDVSVVFVVLLVFQGLLYMGIFLPMSAPDEPYHFFQSYLYSNALMFIPSDPESIVMRGSDAAFVGETYTTLSGAYYPIILHEFAPIADNPGLSEALLFSSNQFDMGANPPQLKLLSAIGITIGRLLSLGAVPVYYLGRIFNFAGFVVLAYLSVRFTPVGKRAFMIIACLPITLHITTSYSYDAGIIGLAFLITALCFRGIYTHGKMSGKLKVAIIATAVLLAPCKVLYSVLAILVFLIPASKFNSKKESLAFKFGTFACIGVTILAMRLPGLVTMAGVSAEGEQLSMRGDESGVLYSVSDMLSNPIAFASLFLRTINSLGDWYIGTMIGNSLGWFQTNEPWFIVIAYLFLVLLTIPKYVKSDIQMSMRQRVSFVCIFAIGAFLVFVSMYLGWTFNTETIIMGVQGRYFIPLLPLLVLAFRNKSIVTKTDYSRALLYAVAILNVAYVTRLYAVVLAG